MYADLLHDVFEGILKYDICHIILCFIKNKTFDLELLNIRKENFQYGETENGNKSPPIQIHHLKKFRLKMSAREMLTFAHFFPLMIGDMVERGNDVWKFVINLIEMLDLLLLSEYTNLDLINLQSRISYHNQKYVELFSDTLKPKHHFLIHYSRIVKHSGPLTYLWTFNFESKHRELKTYTKNITSRKNIVLSLAIKFAMSFSEYILNFEKNCFNPTSTKYTVHNSEYSKEIGNTLTVEEFNQCVCITRFSRYGTHYKKHFVIFIYSPNFQPYVIREIYTLRNSTFFVCQKIPVLQYNQHLISYEVSCNLSEFLIFDVDCIKSPPIHFNIVNGKYFLRPKPLYQ